MAKMKIDYKRLAVKTLGVGSGAVAGEVISKQFANLNPNIRSIGKIVVGAIIPEFAPKNEFMSGLGAGLTASGAIEFAKNTIPSVVSGADANDSMGAIQDDYQLSGDDDLSGLDSNESMGNTYVGGDED